MKVYRLINKKTTYIGFIVLWSLLFLFFLGERGPVLLKDSGTFIRASEDLKRSYFLYPTLLQLFQGIFGNEIFLYAVVLLQSVLTGATNLAFTEYLGKYFSIDYLGKCILYGMTFLPYAYPLPEHTVNHQIMTEALAYPLFYLYMLFVLKAFLEKKKSMLGIAGIMVALLAMTRSQLILMVIIYVILWIIWGMQYLYAKIRKKSFFWIGLVASFCICVGSTVLIIPKVVEKNVWSQFTDAVTGRTMCAMEEKDRELFDGHQQQMFDSLFAFSDKNRYREQYFSEGNNRWDDILHASNENTKNYNKIVGAYFEEIGEPIQNTRKEVAPVIAKLFRHHMGDYMTMTIDLCIQSFVAAIFIKPPAIYTLCCIIAFALYLLSITLLGYGIGKVKIDLKYAIPMFVTLLNLVGVVVITNLLFFAMQRYVVYTFGCFYISLFILILGIIRKKKELKNS